MKQIEGIGLFVGIGGIEYGLEKSGRFKTVAFVEKDNKCKGLLSEKWPNVEILSNVERVTVIEKNGRKYLVETDKTKTKIIKRVDISSIDFISGGFPCTDISIGGKQKGFVDEKKKKTRSGLWKDFKRIIKKAQPKVVLIENVGALLGKGFVEVLQDLHEIGYDVEWHIIETTLVNLPHRRERCFIISHRRSLRLHERLGQERQIQADQEWQGAGCEEKREGRLPKSIKVCQILSDRPFERFRDAHPYRMSTVSKLRRVTDGIPDELHEKERQVRIKQIGNAVCPDIPMLIGESIYEVLEKLEHSIAP